MFYFGLGRGRVRRERSRWRVHPCRLLVIIKIRHTDWRAKNTLRRQKVLASAVASLAARSSKTGTTISDLASAVQFLSPGRGAFSHSSVSLRCINELFNHSWQIKVLCVAMGDWNCSLLLGDGLGGLADGSSSGLSVDHDLEALEVAQVGAGLFRGELLGEGHGVPLLSEALLLADSEDLASAGGAGDAHLQLRERQSFQRLNHSWEVFAVNEDAVGVGDVDDHDLLSVVLTVVNVSNSAWLHEVLVSLHARKTWLDSQFDQIDAPLLSLTWTPAGVS